MIAAELLDLKRTDPARYRAELSRIEADILGTKRAIIEDSDLAKSDLTPGLPSQAAGVKAYKTDSRGKVTRPRWLTDSVRETLDNALDYAPDPHFAKQAAIALGLQDWTLEVYAVAPDGTEADDVDPFAQAAVEAFAGRVFRAYGGGIQAMLEVGLDSVLRRGAVAPELDVADSLDDVLDVDFVPPEKVDFKVETDGLHRSIYPVYIPTSGDPVPFNENTFAYVGASARLGYPHGASPFLPLVDTTNPAVQTRDNLERVGQQQAWARLSFVLDFDKVARAAPPDIVRVNPDGTWSVIDFDRFSTYLNDVRGDLEDKAERMYADDTWVMYDTVSAGSVGADHSSQSFKPLELTQVFDQDNIVACMGQPAIHGRNWGAALSTTGSVQWMVYALGLEGLRDIPRRAVEFVLNAYLRIRGIRAVARLVFEPITKSDEYIDAQTEQLRTQTVLAQLQAGLIDDNEAAMVLVGHGVPEREEVQRLTTEQVLNGAQVQAAQAIITDVAQGKLPRDTGVQMISVFFNIAPEQADEIMGSVGAGFVPTFTEEKPIFGRASAIADVGSARNGEGTAHRNGCGDKLLTVDMSEPFTPDDPHPLGHVEADEDSDVDNDDAKRVSRDWDKWAGDNAPTFVGLLEAEVVHPTNERDETGPRGAHWTWLSGEARYRYVRPGRLGRPVEPKTIHRLFEKRLADRRNAASELTDRLLKGDIDVRQWQTGMMREVKDAHLQARMISSGGRNAMTHADFGAVGGRVRGDYRYLTEFAQQVSRGELSPAQIRMRGNMYFQANIRETYRRGEARGARVAGFTEELNVLGIADHCWECEEQSARGWVPMGSLIELGGRACHSHCACSIIYRRPEDGAVTGDIYDEVGAE